MNELERYEAPVVTHDAPAPRIISRRLYNAVLAGLVLLSFVVMAACSHLTQTLEFWYFLSSNALMFSILTLVGSIGGIIVMSIGRSKENLPLALVGYAIFTLTFGFTTSLALAYYSLDSISMAFTATAGIMVVFGCAGLAFPKVFAKIQGVCVMALLAVILVEAVLSLLGFSQGLLDYAVVLIFCGFIGFDVYRASVAVPTFTNAVWYAIELYLDIINVFLRLLSIFGRRD